MPFVVALPSLALRWLFGLLWRLQLPSPTAARHTHPNNSATPRRFALASIALGEPLTVP